MTPGEERSESRERALGIALAYVNRRERTAAEVRAHLERREISPEPLEMVLEELADQRLVDDARFAEMFVADKRALEQWGSERIRRGLAARGVEREIAERALAAADATEAADAAGRGVHRDPDAEDEAGSGGPETVGELGRALALLRRRFPDPPRERRERDRALGVLMRKGYESELALDALAAHARGE